MTTKRTPNGWNAQPVAAAPAINDGGPAFPALYEGSTRPDAMGMTLRDYFAAKAMQGEVAACHEKRAVPEEVARYAYAVADAMLAARGAQ
ncbi:MULTISPECIES: hypothetical protein [Achromobacter]|uniref:hypothetical protein n=1 Tax=Achromobacter TaxID=222 RepID=UPI001F13BC50|nr:MULTISPECIES: hypothetical protein [Achromobacter]